MSPSEVVALLSAEKPNLHHLDSDPQNWRIRRDVLEWMAVNVEPGWRTLETGCGYSSIVLAACGAEHTVISPSASEHERIRAWCGEHGIPTGALTFVAAPSEVALPGLEGGDLDMVLVDGCHGFPWPFLDWFYTAEKLRVGGRLIVDDTDLRTGDVLRSFLCSEKERWAHLKDFKRTSLFEKISEDVLKGAEWTTQPWCAKRVSRLGRIRQRMET